MDTGSERLRFLVFGAGAIGTLVGGSLAHAGLPGRLPRTSRTSGGIEEVEVCTSTSTRQDITILNPRVAANLDEALGMRTYDVAIFAVKAYDTQVVIRSFIPYRDRLPVFLCLQNGVENEAALEAALGQERVISGMVTHEIIRKRVGDISLQHRRGMGLGAGHPLSVRLLQALESAGLDPQLYQDTTSMKWSKMVTNLVNNATSAILKMSPAEIFRDRDLARLELAQVRETLQIMACPGLAGCEPAGFAHADPRASGAQTAG